MQIHVNAYLGFPVLSKKIPQIPHYHKALLFACQGMVAQEEVESSYLGNEPSVLPLDDRAIFNFSFVSPNSVHILTMVGVALITGRRVTGLRKSTINPFSILDAFFVVILYPLSYSAEASPPRWGSNP